MSPDNFLDNYIYPFMVGMIFSGAIDAWFLHLPTIKTKFILSLIGGFSLHFAIKSYHAIKSHYYYKKLKKNKPIVTKCHRCHNKLFVAGKVATKQVIVYCKVCRWRGTK